MLVPGSRYAGEALNRVPRDLVPDPGSQRLSEALMRSPPKPGLKPAAVRAPAYLAQPSIRAGSPRPAGSRNPRIAESAKRSTDPEPLLAETRIEPRVYARVTRTALRATPRSGESLTLLPYGGSWMGTMIGAPCLRRTFGAPTRPGKTCLFQDHGAPWRTDGAPSLAHGQLRVDASLFAAGRLQITVRRPGAPSVRHKIGTNRIRPVR